MVFLGNSAWLSIPDESRLLRVDLKARKVTKVVKLPWMQTDRVAAGGGLIWVREAQRLGTEVLGIDAASGRIRRRFDIGGSSIGIAFGAGSLWLVGGGDVIRVDPHTGRTLRHFAANADLLAYGDAALWIASSAGDVWKLDPVADTIVAHAKLHPVIGDLAVGDGSVWVSILGEDKVYQLSEDDLGVQQAAPAGPDPVRITAGGGAVWVANKLASAVSRLGQEPGAELSQADSEPTALQVHDGVVWVPAVPALPPLRPGAGGSPISVPSRFLQRRPGPAGVPDGRATRPRQPAPTCLTTGLEGPRPEVAAAMPTSRRTAARTPSGSAPASASRPPRTSRSRPRLSGTQSNGRSPRWRRTTRTMPRRSLACRRSRRR